MKKRENKKIREYTAHEVTYEAKKLRRRIKLKVVDYYSHCRVSIDIYNLDGQSHHYLMVSKYLELFCEVNDVNELMALKSCQDDLVFKSLKDTLERIKEKLDDRFKAILLGTDWVEIPFDWQGYK